MLMLAADSVITGFSIRVLNASDLVFWLTAGLVAKSMTPAIWLAFSVMYSRGEYRQSLRNWAIPIALIGVIPFGLAIGFRDSLFRVIVDQAVSTLILQSGSITRMLNVILLLSLMLVLTNVEQTFRSAVGTARWRIKFVVLGLAVIFGARIYVRTQGMLFAVPDIAHWGIESGGLLVGCAFLAVAHARTGLAEIDVYPSLAVLRSSLTIILVGAYLFIVGVLAQFVRRFGGAESFQLQAFIILVGMSGLALLLLSDRARQRIHVFAVRHFTKARHDSLHIWTTLSARLARVTTQSDLCEASVKLISETFDALSVRLWLLDSQSGRMTAAATTAPATVPQTEHPPSGETQYSIADELDTRAAPFDLDDVHAQWAERFRELNPSTFPHGGHRWCVPLRVGEHAVGVMVLADRVNGARYTVEELELLKCIGDQITSVLLNLRLAAEVASAKEFEAFRTMSTFFVHDLKNAAASLNLMLKNLPVHFDDPAFRADALRGIGNTTRRIEEMIERLSTFRDRPALAPVASDLNALVTEVLDGMALTPGVAMCRELQPLPPISVDPNQMRSVVTNLVGNAHDALQKGGEIRVRTEITRDRVLLSIADNGPGMPREFVEKHLFRPFQSTKKNGLGIGLFQCRAIVQAHGGGIHVDSGPDKGTTFTVSLPAGPTR